MIATYNNHKEVVILLLTNGADKNIKDKVTNFFNLLIN